MVIRSTIFSIIAIFAFFGVQAQETQWVSTILEASSELTPREYSAMQIIGKPNVSPGMEDSPNAWMPFRDDREEYVKVGFENPIRIQQIAIAESMNPSAVYQIYLYDESDNEYLINTFDPRPIDLKSRMLHVYFDLTEYKVAAVKVVLHCDAVPGYNAIDAIAISSTNLPVKQEVLIIESEMVNVKTDRLGETVNSSYNEMKPLITPDGKTLLFSRQYHPDNVGGEDDPEDIWFSQWDEEKGEWMEAENMGAPLNTKGPNYISSITPDGNTVIITLGNRYNRSGKMKAGASVSTRTSQGWSKPVPFEIINEINLSKNSNYFLANNREVLIMSIESEPTFGARDLYVSFLMDDGRWSEPLNLGETLNTAMEETSPFLAADDKTLYFSSNGFTGYGKHDIYVSRRLDDSYTRWSEPENLGPQINSPEDDAFFNIPPAGDYGYFSRNVSENNADIFRFELPTEHQPETVVTIKGVVLNSLTNEPIQAKIIYESLEDGKELGSIESDPVTGEYQIIVPVGTKYSYRAEADGYIAINANLDLIDREDYGELSKNLLLVPIEKGAVARLNNIEFESNKSTLKESSFPELDRIAKMMAENSSVRVSIEGHTDSIGREIDNIKLSQDRAQAVVDYLLQQGVETDRIEAVGWGEAKPIASNDVEEGGRALNRRVEIKILDN